MAYFERTWLRLFLLVTLGYVVNSVLVCEDKSGSCKKWAFKKGLCYENVKYKKQRFYVSMSKLCKKSCDMCGDDDYTLFDTDSRCNSYATKGYCDMRPHQGFMLRRCKYSCRRTIRNGITSPGRGNFQRKDPPVLQQQPQQQGNWNQHLQSDNRYPQNYGQQYSQGYAQQYPQQYPQQYNQQYGQQNPQQNNAQQGAQQSAQQGAQQGAQQDAQGQSIANMPVQVQALKKHKLEKKNDVKSKN